MERGKRQRLYQSLTYRYPETIDSTTLAETEWMTSVKGLKNPGGALEFGANLTDDLYDFWNQALADFDTAVLDRKTLWWVVAHPKLKFATYFTGEPSPLGLNEAAVGGMAETTLYVTPTGAIEHADTPTLDTDTGGEEAGGGGARARRIRNYDTV